MTMASRCCGAILVSCSITDAQTKRTQNWWCCTRCGAKVLEDKRRYNFMRGVRVRVPKKQQNPPDKIKAITTNRIVHRPPQVVKINKGNSVAAAKIGS